MACLHKMSCLYAIDFVSPLIILIFGEIEILEKLLMEIKS